MNTTHEEQIRQVIRQLAVEQTVYIVPGNAPDLPAKDIRLETAKISEIPDTGHIIRIRKPDGAEEAVDIDIWRFDILYLGTIGRKVELDDWVFLSEANFWAWWEWFVLTDRLNGCITFNQGWVDEFPTQENLQICRILADVLVHQNLRYQNMDCAGCVYENSSDKSLCANCVRSGKLADRWRGENRWYEP